jgi:hypothetical protein
MTETPKQAAKRLAKPALDRGFVPEALHVYNDERGETIYWRIRARHPDTGEKWIRPMRLNGHGYELAEPEFPNGKKPLYLLDAIAANLSATIYLLEGEKPADALAKIGAITTTSGSSMSANGAYWEPLRGRTVVIWPDNDDAGKAYAGEVATILLALGCTVSAIDVEKLGLPPKGDAVEWLADHRNASLTDLEGLPRIRAQTAAQNAPAGVSEPSAWPEPQPLPSALLPVEPFTLQLLPQALRSWIGDISERVQCPPDFPAVASIVSLGSVIGRRVAILPKRYDSWREYPNLWGAIVGRPGVLKSPALREALRPTRELEAEAASDHQEEMQTWVMGRAEATIRRRASEQNALKAAKKGAAFDAREFVPVADDEEPAMRRFIVNDSSVEALGEVLRGNPNGTLLYQDELIGLLRQLDKEGNEGARAFYLAGWSGSEPYTFDRIGRGLNRRIDAVCLALLGSIQPAIIGEALRGAVASNGGDGLLARFSMLTWPDISDDWRNVDRFPDSEAYAAAAATFRRCEALDVDTLGAVDVGEFGKGLRFDAKAQSDFDSWRETFERAQRTSNDHPALIAHRDKYRKLIPALALVCHLADNPAGGPIGPTPLLRALGWAEYLDSHARRAYASVSRADLASARELLRRIRAGEVADSFRARDIYIKGWSRLATPEQAHSAARTLAEFDYLREHDEQTGGRSTTRYEVNPRGRA